MENFSTLIKTAQYISFISTQRAKEKAYYDVWHLPLIVFILISPNKSTHNAKQTNEEQEKQS